VALVAFPLVNTGKYDAYAQLDWFQCPEEHWSLFHGPAAAMAIHRYWAHKKFQCPAGH
jgi:hypothetical protein